MGNCFKRSTTDDISLLRGGNEPNRESTEQLGPAPLYSVCNSYAWHLHDDDESILKYWNESLSNFRQIKIDLLLFITKIVFFYSFVSAGGTAASVLSIAIGQPACDSFDRGGTSENSKTYRFNTTLAGRIVWWVQKSSWMCDLYDWIQCRRLDPLSTLYAHLSRWLYRWLVNAKSHVPQLHGTSRCSLAYHLWDMLITAIDSKKRRNMLIAFPLSLISSSDKEGTYNKLTVFSLFFLKYFDKNDFCFSNTHKSKKKRNNHEIRCDDSAKGDRITVRFFLLHGSMNKKQNILR